MGLTACSGPLRLAGCVKVSVAPNGEKAMQTRSHKVTRIVEFPKAYQEAECLHEQAHDAGTAQALQWRMDEIKDEFCDGFPVSWPLRCAISALHERGFKLFGDEAYRTVTALIEQATGLTHGEFARFDDLFQELDVDSIDR